MTNLRTVAQQALEALEIMQPEVQMGEGDAAIAALRAALAEPCPCGDRSATECPGEWEPGCDLGNNPKYAKRVNLAEPTLQTCNCRWNGEVQVQQCTLHEAHVDAIKEWAQRAKFAEKKLAALAEPVQEPVAWMDPSTGEVCRASWLESHAPERDVDRFSRALYTTPRRG